MELVNCKKCGRVFCKKLRDICDDCISLENNKIEKIHRCIEHTKESFVSIIDLSVGTEIEITEIEDFLKKGKLLGSYVDKIAINCKSCGVLIKEKDKKNYFCEKCIQTIFKPEEKTFGHESKKIVSGIKIVSSKTKFGFKKDYD